MDGVSIRGVSLELLTEEDRRRAGKALREHVEDRRKALAKLDKRLTRFDRNPAPTLDEELAFVRKCESCGFNFETVSYAAIQCDCPAVA